MESHIGQIAVWRRSWISFFFTMLSMIRPSVSQILRAWQQQPVSSHQRLTEEPPMSRAPRTCVSTLDQQSDATEVSVSCVDRDSASSAIRNSVYGASFSGKRVLELWPILFAAVHDFGAFSCGTDPGNSGTSEQPSHATLSNRSNSCGSHLPKSGTVYVS